MKKNIAWIIYGLFVMVLLPTLILGSLIFVTPHLNLTDASTAFVVGYGITVALALVAVGSVVSAVGQDIYRRFKLLKQTLFA